MNEEELKQKLRIYRILTQKCNEDIKSYTNRIRDEIEKSGDENRFLNLNVWIESIQNEIEVLRTAEKLSIKDYREFKELE